MLTRTGVRQSGLALLALTALPLAAAAEPPERAGYQIGYTAHRVNLPGGQFANRSTSRAFLVEGDGSGTRQLAPELTRKANQWAQLAGWSPDGRQAILLQCWESAENGAWEHQHKDFRFTAEHWLVDSVFLNIQTNKLTNLTAVERVSFYNHGVHFWPNQPKRLAFVALIDGQLRPFAMDLDGRNKKALSEGPGFIYGLNVSPDGKRICYHKDYRSIYVADADGGNARRVQDDHLFQFLPQWSPDGKWIAYLSGEHYDCHPHLVRADGTGLRKLGDRGGYRGVFETLDGPDFHSARSDIPTWSPDGKWLYYTAQVGKAVELMRASPEGRREQLTRSKPGVLNYLPQVSPDSRWVVFGSIQTGVRQLHVARADGSAACPLTSVEPGWGAFLPYWRPK
jgi:Tol biopolymer transport system component